MMDSMTPLVASTDARTAVLERARALIPVLAARSGETESRRRVPDETIADFHNAGLFRVLQPARFGGLELDFDVFATITKELARGCASSAWVYAGLADGHFAQGVGAMAEFGQHQDKETERDDFSGQLHAFLPKQLA